MSFIRYMYRQATPMSWAERSGVVLSFIRIMFCLATLLSSVMAIFRGGIWFGLSGLAASFMAIIAGGVTILIFRRGSNRIGEAVFILITLLGGALYWVESIGWDFQLWGIHLSGLAWCLIGFGISFLFRAVAAD